MPGRVTIQPLVISAPFGNYIRPRGATATIGTFTAQRRPGRWWRIIRTVRYYPRLGAWVNQLGLRNPGIEWAVERARRGELKPADKILSIHGFEPGEWSLLLARAAELRPLALELNMSCPNVGTIDWPPWLFERAIATDLRVIVKLPPVSFQDMARMALDAGIRCFHCCNTLPVPRGGLSGKPLKPVALQCIREVRALARGLGMDGVRIIGGGGITSPADIDDFAASGADHAAIGTKAMNPWLLVSDAPLAPLVRHAASVFGSR